MKVLRRILLISLRLLMLLMALVLLIYALIALSPLDPVLAYMGGNITAVSGAQKQELISQLGLDTSILSQFMHWFRQLLMGNLGFSQLYHQEVTTVIVDRIGLSLILVFTAWVLSLLLGYVLGVFTAIKRHCLLAKLLHKLMLVMTIIPPFWLGMMAIAIFAINLHWLPTCCAAPLGMLWTEQSASDLALHLALPLLSLVLIYMAPIALHTHEKVIDVLSSDYVKYSYLHRQTPAQMIRFHVLRNSILPAIVLQFAAVAELVGGSMMIETVFNLPGLGSALVKSAMGNDTALLLAISMLFAVMVFICSNLGRLLSYRLLPAGAD